MNLNTYLKQVKEEIYKLNGNFIDYKDFEKNILEEFNDLLNQKNTSGKESFEETFVNTLDAPNKVAKSLQFSFGKKPKLGIHKILISLFLLTGFSYFGVLAIGRFLFDSWIILPLIDILFNDPYSNTSPYSSTYKTVINLAPFLSNLSFYMFIFIFLILFWILARKIIKNNLNEKEMSYYYIKRSVKLTILSIFVMFLVWSFLLTLFILLFFNAPIGILNAYWSQLIVSLYGFSVVGSPFIYLTFILIFKEIQSHTHSSDKNSQVKEISSPNLKKIYLYFGIIVFLFGIFNDIFVKMYSISLSYYLGNSIVFILLSICFFLINRHELEKSSDVELQELFLSKNFFKILFSSIVIIFMVFIFTEIVSYTFIKITTQNLINYLVQSIANDDFTPYLGIISVLPFTASFKIFRRLEDNFNPNISV